MGDKSNIEWTSATWNPTVGCSILTPGCTNCYAMKMAARIVAMNPNSHYAGTTTPSKAGPVWTGKMVLSPDNIITLPLRWKRPRTIFVNSMSDLFHEDVPDEWIDKVFAVMALSPQHTFQVLTKRAERMRAYMTHTRLHEWMNAALSLGGSAAEVGRNGKPLPNVWLGVSAERQPEFDERWRHLQATPAAVTFVSMEPLLGPIFFRPAKPDWVIVGGESGRSARPMHPDWAREIRDQCEAQSTPFFFKQWGEWAARPGTTWHEWIMADSSRHSGGFDTRRHLESVLPPDSCGIERVGKKAAGRLLDGKEHNGMPIAREAQTA